MNQELTHRIERWQKEVGLTTPSLKLTTKGYGPNGIRLRETAQRTYLAEVSGNTRQGKRKRPAMDEGYTSDNPDRGSGTPPKRKRRRPRLKPPSGPDVQSPVSAVKLTASPAKKANSKSPTKRGMKSIHDARPEIAIDLQYLAQCVPSVIQVDIFELLKEGQLPSEVETLWRKLDRVPIAVVPRELKEQYDLQFNTPTCSVSSPFEEPRYVPIGVPCPHPQERLGHLKSMVESIHRNAASYARLDSSEDQWKGLVHRLLYEFETSSMAPQNV
ncbi:uncharacterized protein KY384_002879 [Bacidia gigantensis]|uniref:uncharacterized protein n=1 Tax=Bacidia gigantensis TaxID=2732470 RepID=UPI001D04CEFD|nr:uncharacterized protein KY384_002879 [Bacidia gigantensis]KAG8532394.1 hypothetical protein KY384_002879 [Bacidia gigantensis]